MHHHLHAVGAAALVASDRADGRSRARSRATGTKCRRSARGRGDRVERHAPRLGSEQGHGPGRDHQQHRDGGEDRRHAEPVLDPQDGRDDERGGESPGTRGHAEARRAGIGREHLGSEDLRRVAGKLGEEDHPEADDQQHRIGRRAGEGGGEHPGEDEVDDHGHRASARTVPAHTS